MRDHEGPQITTQDHQGARWTIKDHKEFGQNDVALAEKKRVISEMAGLVAREASRTGLFRMVRAEYATSCVPIERLQCTFTSRTPTTHSRIHPPSAPRTAGNA